MDFYRPPSIQGAIDSLGSVYRALRSWKFYPKGHPTRRSSINHAHSSLLLMLDGKSLSLLCGRNGFSFPDGEKLIDSSSMSASLSYELFIRRVQKLTFQGDLYQEDLLDFLRTLALSPEHIHKAGGMDRIMEEHGIRSIWVNEFDLSVIRAKRRTVEIKGIKPQSVDELEESDIYLPSNEFPIAQDDSINPEQELQVLIGRLTTTLEEDRYLLLSRQAIACADLLKSRRELAAIQPLVELLAVHIKDQTRSLTMREYAEFVLEQLLLGDGFLAFIFSRMEVGEGLSRDGLVAVLTAGGASAVVTAVEQMAITSNLAVRKTLSTCMSKLGDQAVPALLSMIGDKRWFIVRNIAAILGVIASKEAVPDLINCLKHPDIRVCKEVMRSLSLIGGADAEAAILSVLRGGNPALQPQAIASLGGMKSVKALPDLLKIVLADDMFLKTLAIKQEALVAIGMIGYPQVTPPLLDMLGSRRLVAPARWKQFRISIVHCLAKLGDRRCLPVLSKMASGTGDLEKACAEALELIERTGSNLHGNA